MLGGRFGRCVAVQAKHILPHANIFNESDVNVTCNAVLNVNFALYLENPELFYRNYPTLIKEKGYNFLPKIFNNVTCQQCVNMLVNFSYKRQCNNFFL